MGAPEAGPAAEGEVGTGANARTGEAGDGLMADAAGGEDAEGDWEELDSGDWVAGTRVGTVRPGAGALAEAGSEGAGTRVGAKAEAAADEAVAGQVTRQRLLQLRLWLVLRQRMLQLGPWLVHAEAGAAGAEAAAGAGSENVVTDDVLVLRQRLEEPWMGLRPRQGLLRPWLWLGLVLGQELPSVGGIMMLTKPGGLLSPSPGGQ